MLFREWNPETWEFGHLYEVSVDKNANANKLTGFLADKIFPHIGAENITCSKIYNVRNFRRGDLILKKWAKPLYQLVPI